MDLLKNYKSNRL